MRKVYNNPRLVNHDILFMSREITAENACVKREEGIDG